MLPVLTQAIKTDIMLHSYGLSEKPHHINKNASVFETGYFSNIPVFDAKGSEIYVCTNAIWSTEYVVGTHYRWVPQ